MTKMSPGEPIRVKPFILKMDVKFMLSIQIQIEIES